MRRRRAPILQIVERATQVLLALTMATVAARAQMVFSTPQNVSNSGNTGSQQIAIDANGDINTVWLDNTVGSYAVLFSRSSNGGMSFSIPINVSNHPGSNATSPQIGLDPGGNIYIIWNDNSSGNYASFFSRSINAGASFSAPLLVSASGATTVGAVRIAVDVSGNINVVWTDNSPGYSAVFFSRSADGGTSFSSPVNVSNNSLGAGSPNIGVDLQGNIYVVWEGGSSVVLGGPTSSTQDAFLSVSANGGTTFSAPVNVSNDQVGILVSNPQVVATSVNSINILWETEQMNGGNWSLHYRPASNGGTTLGSISSSSDDGQYDQVAPLAHMALDSTGAINVVWQQNSFNQSPSGILYARSTDAGNSFAVSTIANAGGNTPSPQLAIDSLNNLDVVFYGTTASGNNQISFMQSTTQGATFSGVESVSSNSANGVLPQMALDTGGNIHVFWQQGASNQDIFYSRSVGLSSLSVAPSSIGGGGSSTGTVTLNGPAPINGAVIALSSDNTAAASVPASATVAPGATSATFSVTTSTVTASSNVSISGTYNGATQSALLGIEASTLNLLSLSPTSVTGGASSTGTINLTSPAPSGGTVVSLSSSDPSVAAVPDFVTVPAGATSATFAVATSAVSASTSVVMTAASSGITQTVALTVLPPTLMSVSMTPARLTGGNSSVGTVSLSGPAPSGGLAISLSSSDSSVAAVSSSMTVPAGATSATFTATTAAVATSSSVSIFATNSGVTQSALIVIVPPTLMSLTLSPSGVTGGGSSTGTVTLDGPAPAGGIVVFLSSSSSAAMVPSSVIIPAACTTATFAVSTLPVVLSTNVTITASYKGVSRAAVLTVGPPI
jgi:hypothetical protein